MKKLRNSVKITAFQPSTLENLFYRGDYQPLLQLTVDSSAGFDPGDDQGLIFTIGALAFTGRLEEAETLFQDFSKASIDASSACRFFLGIAHCRQSHYEKSLSLFSQNIREMRKVRSLRTHPLLRFYALQGIGFYRFFSGRFSKSLRAARIAHQAAFRAQFLWGRLISTDLIGHSLIQTGEISLGIQNLKKAHEYAVSLGNGGTKEAIEVALACYHAQFGLSPETAISELQKSARKISDQDTYSHAAILLELGRQLTLRGKINEAKQILNQSCRYIYGSRNRRQGVLLNLRYALIHDLCGESEQGLNLLLNASKELVPGIDLALEVEVLGMQKKILERLGLMEKDSVLTEKIRELTFLTQKGTSLRMLKRQTNSLTHLHSPGEDKIGDLADRASTQELIESGFLGLLYQNSFLVPGDRTLYFELIRGSLLIQDSANITWIPDGITPIMIKIVKLLASPLEQEISKETLIEKVWEYRYHPAQHDQLIYSTISRLRNLLGSHSSWIEARENGYTLLPGVQIKFERPAQVMPPLSKKPLLKNRPQQSELNHRQLKILKILEQEEIVNTRTCMRRFQVSEITASRDLSGLHQQGLVRKTGRGRTTSYQSIAFQLPEIVLKSGQIFAKKEVPSS